MVDHKIMSQWILVVMDAKKRFIFLGKSKLILMASAIKCAVFNVGIMLSLRILEHNWILKLEIKS